MNRRSFFRDALLSFAAATALATTRVEIFNREPPSDDRFVSSTAGNDAWDGTSPVHIEGTNIGPWKTIARASRDFVPTGALIVSQGHYDIDRPINLVGFDAVEFNGACNLRRTTPFAAVPSFLPSA